LRNGDVHDWTAQVVPMHEGVPFCTAQTLPQPPQAATLLTVAVSHPFETVASQLPYPDAHEIEQLPAEQDAAPWFVLQTFPHAPQFDVFVAVFTSQPLDAVMSQSANVESQLTTWHVPVAHDSTAFGSEQTTPHPPQFDVVLRFTSQPFAGLPSQSA
jgi:hypothetical protein